METAPVYGSDDRDQHGDLVAFEADSYDDLDRSGWSVVVNGFAEVIDDDTSRHESRQAAGARDPVYGSDACR